MSVARVQIPAEASFSLTGTSSSMCLIIFNGGQRNVIHWEHYQSCFWLVPMAIATSFDYNNVANDSILMAVDLFYLGLLDLSLIQNPIMSPVLC